MNFGTKILLISTLLVCSTVLASAATVQHHPFSEIFPPDTDLDFGENSAYNLSRVNLDNGMIIEGNAIQDGGDSDLDIARFKDSGKVTVPRGNLNMSLNDIKEVKDIHLGQGIRIRDDYGVIETSGTGSGVLAIGNGTEEIARFNDNGNIEFPNGKVSLSGNDLEKVRDIYGHNNQVISFFGASSTTNFKVDDGSGSKIDTLTLREGGNAQLRNGDLVFKHDNNIRDSGGTVVKLDGNQNLKLPNGDLVIDRSTEKDQNSILSMETDGGNSYADINYVADGNHLEMIRLGNDSNGGTVVIQNRDGTNTDQLRINGNNNVEIPNGNLKMGSNKIQNLKDPTNEQDAATKSYVDTSDDTISDDQNLKDVLSRGNTANKTIDMNGENLKNPNCIGEFC